MLLKPQNAIKMIDAIAQAVRGREIAIEQIDHSVEKLLYCGKPG